jgi:hypothetical protein
LAPVVLPLALALTLALALALALSSFVIVCDLSMLALVTVLPLAPVVLPLARKDFKNSELGLGFGSVLHTDPKTQIHITQNSIDIQIDIQIDIKII